MQVETVKVKFENEQGYIIINKSDFDEKKHILFEEKPARRTKKA